jgi:DNA-binding NtrC family response regulator
MILLIDNDEAFRDRLIGCLRWLSDDVYACASTEELPPLSALPRPMVLVTRYELPDEDGLSFADRFHEAHPRVPIFLLTGAWSPDLAQQVRMRSFLWMRQVPVGFEELCTLILSVCGRRQTGLAAAH